MFTNNLPIYQCLNFNFLQTIINLKSSIVIVVVEIVVIKHIF